MKRKGIFWLIVLIGWTNYARTQIAFPTQDANWCYLAYGDNGQNYGISCLSPDSQVVVGGQTYTKILYSPHPYVNSEEILYREDNGRFYVIPQDSIHEILVYDFNLQVGDLFQTDWAWSLHDSIDLFVTNVSTITTLDGVQRKRIDLSGGYYSAYGGTWIEGIGSLDWVFVFPAYNGSLSGGYQFVCHSRADTIVYPSWADSLDCGFLSTIDQPEEEFTIEIYPNPVHTSLYVDLLNTKAKKLIVTDLTGRVVLEHQITNIPFELQLPDNMPPGIYLMKIARKDESFLVKKFIKN